MHATTVRVTPATAEVLPESGPQDALPLQRGICA